MEDSEYPSWLWSLLDPPKKTWMPEEQFDRRYFQQVNREKIKVNNLKKNKS